MFIIYKGEGTVFGDSSTYIKPEMEMHDLETEAKLQKMSHQHNYQHQKKHIDLY